VRGIGAERMLRLTRKTDGASVLLHQVEPRLREALAGMDFRQQPVDFARPFVTNIAGILQYENAFYLVEPLPPCVPLLAVWTEVLRCAPQQSFAVAQMIIRQLWEALDKLHASGQQHHAVCAENVVLTTMRSYGLLTEGVQTPTGWVWFRHANGTSDVQEVDDSATPTVASDSLAPITRALATMAIDAGVWSEAQRACAHLDRVRVGGDSQRTAGVVEEHQAQGV
jgi:hypothetical protein